MKPAVVATVAGGVAFLVAGALLYQVLLGDFYAANLGSATGVVREIPIGWALALSQLGYGALVTFVFLHAGVTTANRGLATGALLGLLLGVAIAFNLYAVTNWSNVTVAFVEPFVSAAKTAAAGSAVGWCLGRGHRRVAVD